MGRFGQAVAEVAGRRGGAVLKHDNDNALVTGRGLRFLSVCSGIEAASVAWPQWEAVAFAEIEKFPSAVLAHHYPDVPNLGDFTKIDTTTLGQVDILCGGTPCQAFSVAGARRSLDDERGNLTLAFVELAHELAGYGKTTGNGLRNVIWENVPGVLSTKDNAFGCFLAGLVGADDPIVPSGKWTSHGMVAGPKGWAAWAVKDAQFFGLAQRRKRVIVVADFGSGADPAAVLFEPESVYRDTPPSREAREGVARGFECGPQGGGFTEISPTLDTRCKDGPIRNQLGAGVMTYGIPGNWIGRAPENGGNAVEPKVEVSPCLTKADRHGVATFDRQSNCEYGEANIASTVSARDYKSPTDLVTCVHGTQDPCTSKDTAFALGRNNGAENVVAWSIMPQNSGKDYKARQVEVAQPLMAGGPVGGNQGGDYIQHQFAVRRLTPTECERLQGFPDGYTDIPWRGQPNSPDGPRYKALGNSWAVPKFKWLGERIARLMPANDNTPHNTEEYHAA